MTFHRKTTGSVRPDMESLRVTTEGVAHPDTKLPLTKAEEKNLEDLSGVVLKGGDCLVLAVGSGPSGGN
ncbi:hypothetical protein DPMN_163937 [Dreissena polymorpha]|uniref:Uncharacterized protein n=1 Tax=Dreissena polymorpha TaxID=45954 RepID=A0A9D4IV31_DREPO|nr:hypothetical protein DPMN_163937 [Dreissena polymorpha]